LKIDLTKIKKKNYYLFFFIITFIIYGNSINNEYALDDNIVVEGNEMVEKGLSGTAKIFTSHYAKDKTQNYEYRPIVIFSFALENQFFGNLTPSQTIKQKKKRDKLTRANVSHFINLILYALTCVFLFTFLKQILLQYNSFLPFLITLMFLLHPLHTEPVCNIKSRDELLMFLFMLLALINYVKYTDLNKLKYLAFGITFSVLAILSKKSAIAMIGILPVILYFKGANYKKIFFSLLFIFVSLIIFIVIKRALIESVGQRDYLFHENPLRFSDNYGDRILLALSSSFFYLKMLLFPKDLSFYYGYNQIEIPNWKSIEVWLGLLFYLPVGAYGFILFLKRNVLGLGIVLWFGVMLSVVNLFFPIVGIVADRFTYVFSMGFCIVISILLIKLFKIEVSNRVKKVNLSNGFVIAISCVFLFSAGRVMSRNLDWENYITLFRHDNEHLQNSAKANPLLGDYLYKDLPLEQNPQVRLKMFVEMEKHYLQAISIYPNYFSPNNNLGTAYFTFKGDLESAKKYFSKALSIDSTAISTRYNLARAYEQLGDVNMADQLYAKTIEDALKNDEDLELAKKSHSYRGMMFIKKNDIKRAFTVYENALIDFPNEPEFNYNFANLYLAEKDTLVAINYYERGYQSNSDNKKVAQLLAKLYYKKGNIEKSNYYRMLLNK
jgi:protein O-mannosyl-transferase